MRGIREPRSALALTGLTVFAVGLFQLPVVSSPLTGPMQMIEYAPNVNRTLAVTGLLGALSGLFHLYRMIAVIAMGLLAVTIDSFLGVPDTLGPSIAAPLAEAFGHPDAAAAHYGAAWWAMFLGVGLLGTSALPAGLATSPRRRDNHQQQSTGAGNGQPTTGDA